MEAKTDRRTFFRLGGRLLAGSVLASGFMGVRQARAGTHGPAYEVDASREGICATCQYWGGVRKASKDKKTVVAQSLGWCNNPGSMNYHRTTTPETGPMKAWKKWEALV